MRSRSLLTCLVLVFAAFSLYFYVRVQGLEYQLIQLQQQESPHSQKVPVLSPEGSDPESSGGRAAAKNKDSTRAAQQASDQSFTDYRQDPEGFIANTKVSAIEKFVALEDEQRDRLQDKFRAEMEFPGDPDIETLDEILGTEQAEFYRAQRKKAFERGKWEDMEKETLFLSRSLSLSQGQESQLRSILENLEEEVGRWQKDNPRTMTMKPRQRLSIYLAELRLRQRLRRERLAPVLSPEQQELLARYEKESSEGDALLWHEPAEEQE